MSRAALLAVGPFSCLAWAGGAQPCTNRAEGTVQVRAGTPSLLPERLPHPPTPRDRPGLFQPNAWEVGQPRQARDLAGAPKLGEVA